MNIWYSSDQKKYTEWFPWKEPFYSWSRKIHPSYLKSLKYAFISSKFTVQRIFSWLYIHLYTILNDQMALQKNCVSKESYFLPAELLLAFYSSSIG